MSGKVQQHGRKVSVRVWVRSAVDGERYQRRVSANTKAELRKEITKVLADSDTGNLSDPGRLTVSEFLTQHWLPAVSRVSKRGHALAPTARQRYADAVAHVTRIIGAVKLRDLAPKHVRKVRDDLLGKLAPQTVGDVLRVLSQTFRRAVVEGLFVQESGRWRCCHAPDRKTHAVRGGHPAAGELDPGSRRGR